jgi:hypothetical protein
MRAMAAASKTNRDPALRSEDVTKLAKGDFFVSKLIIFSAAFCGKTKKSQPLRMTTELSAAINGDDRH